MLYGAVLQGVDPPDVFEGYVDTIEDLGYDHLWLTDSSLHSRNPYVYLTLAARRTSRIRLGTAVTNPVTRHPAITAVAIASLDEVAGGRAILGIGAGDRPLQSLGLDPAPLSNLGETVTGIRSLLRNETVNVAGKHVQLHDAHLRFEARQDIEIFVSASGPKTLEFAGRMADGVILLAGLHPEGVSWAIRHIERGAEQAGRSSRPQVAVFAYGMVDEDEARALAAARTIAAWFPQTAPMYCKLAGLDMAIVEKVRSSYGGGEFQEAQASAELLPESFVRRMALAGGRQAAMQHIRNLKEVGVDSVHVFPLGDDRMETVKAFADCAKALASASDAQS